MDELKGMTPLELQTLKNHVQGEIDRRKEVVRIASLRNLQTINLAASEVGKLLDVTSARGLVVTFVPYKEGD